MGKQIAPSGELTFARVLALVARGLTLRCPGCGAGSLSVSWFRMRKRCPRCELPLERREKEDKDYFLGAMMFNLVASELIYAGGMLIWLLATWPDVPWDVLQYGGVLFMVAAPFLFYPLSKTLWLAMDLTFRPFRHEELEWHGGSDEDA
jgi:uncharacterized protein (DUF983 family)